MILVKEIICIRCGLLLPTVVSLVALVVRASTVASKVASTVASMAALVGSEGGGRSKELVQSASHSNTR